MKLSFVSKIFLFGIFLMSSFFVFGNESYGQQNCIVSNVNWSRAYTGNNINNFVSNIEDANVNLGIDTQNCEDGVELVLFFIDDNGSKTRMNSVLNLPNNIKPNNNGDISIKFNTRDSFCYTDNDEDDDTPNWGSECIIFIKIYDSNGANVFDSDTNNLNPDFVKDTNDNILRSAGIFTQQCNIGGCDTLANDLDDYDGDDIWKFDQLIIGSSQNPVNCILSNSGTNQDVYFSPVDTSTPIHQATTKLHIKTKDKCEGLPLSITFSNHENARSIDFENPSYEDFDSGDLNRDWIRVIPPQGEDTEITIKLGEDDCLSARDPDCQIYIENISLYGNSIFSSKEFIDIYDDGNNTVKTATNFNKGIIMLDCDGIVNSTCSGGSDWEITFTNAIIQEEGSDNEPDDPQSLEPVEPEFLKDSPCYVASSTTPKSFDGLELGEEGYDKGCYELLAPIPGFGEAQVVNGEATGRTKVDLRTLTIGSYLNQMFQIALGILMVLAVVMIVVAGVQYMTSEAIFQKQVAKEYITKAIVGLILGLGIFIILNTINPRLLEINFGSDIDTVSVSIIAEQDTPTTVVLNNLQREQVNDYIFNSGVTCTGSGGQSAIPGIARSFVGKTTYRLGGKYYNLGNAQPAYAGNDVGNSCDISSNTLCLDCSGFTNLVLQCAGVVDLHVGNNLGTSGSFNLSLGAENINSIDLENNRINNQQLEVGDLIGYTGSTFGHIWIYIGNGEVAESTSSGSGRNLNSMVRISKMTNINQFEERVNKIHRFSSFSS